MSAKRYDCVRPYDPSDTTRQKRIDSCAMADEGRFVNIQTCYEQCTLAKKTIHDRTLPVCEAELEQSHEKEQRAIQDLERAMKNAQLIIDDLRATETRVRKDRERIEAAWTHSQQELNECRAHLVGATGAAQAQTERKIDDLWEPSHTMHTIGDDQVTFPDDFDASIDNMKWPTGIRFVVFKGPFNQPIDRVRWPDGIIWIEFGNAFNQDVERVRWPNGIQVIKFGRAFKRSIATVQWPLTAAVFVDGQRVWRHGVFS